MTRGSVVGGASFRGRFGGVYASWPMMTLEVSESEVVVAGRWTWVRRLLVSGASPGWGVHHDVLTNGVWQASWGDLRRVEFVGLRGNVVRLIKAIDDVCEFRAPRARQLRILRRRLDEHSIPASRRLLPPIREPGTT